VKCRCAAGISKAKFAGKKELNAKAKFAAMFGKQLIADPFIRHP